MIWFLYKMKVQLTADVSYEFKDPPRPWLAERKDRDVLIYAGHEDPSDPYEERIGLYPFKSNRPLYDYVLSKQDAASERAPEFEFVDFKNITVGDQTEDPNNAYNFIYKYRNDRFGTMKRAETYTKFGTYGLEITLFAESEKYDLYEKDYNDLLQTVRFKQS